MCIVKEKHTKYIKEKKMSIRKPVRKVVVNTEEEKKRKFILEYYTLEKEIYVEGESHNTYGIEVLKRETTDLGTLRIEYRKVFDIFCTEEEAKTAANILADNTVTPVSVRDVIEQFIGTDEIECEEYEVMAV